MKKKTVADLRVLREELRRQARQAGYELTRSISVRALERLATLSEAMYALDDLIEDGQDED